MVSGVYFMPNLAALAILVLVGLAEMLHMLRIRRVKRLSFGPEGSARRWTAFVPLARALSLALLGWGLVVLYEAAPKVFEEREIGESSQNRLLIVFDVSPSMYLKDAGIGRDLDDPAETAGMEDESAAPDWSGDPITRTRRAAQVMESIMQRVKLRQTLTSIVAFHTDSRPVVVDATDADVIRNVFNDLPLRYAFESGKTRMMRGVEVAAELAEDWPSDSTTLMVISDGDTLPDEGSPPLPASISTVLVLGVGPTDRGKFIDDHFSKQDTGSLERLAQRLGGTYYNVNSQNVPTEAISSLVRPVSLEYELELGRREVALACIGTGSTVFALIPVLLAAVGSAWRIESRKGKRRPEQQIGHHA